MALRIAVERVAVRAPRRRWWVGVALAVTVAAGVVAALERLDGRYRIALDAQRFYACLPFDVFVVDTRPERPIVRGTLVQFAPPPAAKEFVKPIDVVKIVAAVAGDRWRIEHDELFINDRLWGRLHLLARLNLTPGALDGAGIVPPGHVLVLGTTPSSYDSRYWGALPVDRVKGIVHVVV
jgi:conjugal transfer pilin signal peptidase TrbI